MMSDITMGRTPQSPRDTEDIERLLGRWWYPLGRQSLLIGYYLVRRIVEPLKRTMRRTRSYRALTAFLRSKGLLNRQGVQVPGSRD